MFETTYTISGNSYLGQFSGKQKSFNDCDYSIIGKSVQTCAYFEETDTELYTAGRSTSLRAVPSSLPVYLTLLSIISEESEITRVDNWTLHVKQNFKVGVKNG